MGQFDDLSDFGPPTGSVRFKVLGVFAALAGLTYLDRICMAQAATSIRADLGLNAEQMGMVFSAFTLGYALFEVPGGWLGDQIGARRVLFRVVLWWSAFTALTGAVGGLLSLLFVRFAFGAGEAGAFPNIARALTHWFPSHQRGRVQSAIWTTSRVGGALAPILTGYLIAEVGWRWTFAAYGALGLVWAIPFRLWYRDDPELHPEVSDGERAWLRKNATPVAAHGSHGEGAPWGRILTNRSVIGLSAATFWSAFSWYFFITWMPTYLENERGVSLSASSWLSSLPMLLGIFGCALGGWLGDAMVRWMRGPRYARRLLGFICMTLAFFCFLMGMRATAPLVAVLWMAVASFFNDMPQSGLWAANMDVGERHAGSVSGVVASSSAAGAFLSPMIFGWILQNQYGWTPALAIAAVGFLLSGLSWLLVDPTRKVTADGDP